MRAFRLFVYAIAIFGYAHLVYLFALWWLERQLMLTVARAFL